MNYWLFKSEPDAFSIDQLASMPGKRDHWDGIRNYQARNLMRDQMKKGDLGFFYHSSCKVPGVVGIVEIVRESYPDHTAHDPASKYYDAKSSDENPRWCMVDVKLKRKFKEVVSLQSLKTIKGLEDMVLLQKGSRLSVQPVGKKHWDIIVKLVGK
ncbi:EVE domain-containing protein [Chromatiales bacterium (ex Bugula neritina AB1)]|nr:EVE domain-containing protein [Chromatiales bacterium (ex Bugula neritina AB1)]